LRIDYRYHDVRSQTSGRLAVNRRVLRIPDPFPAACEVGFYDQSHLDRHCRKFFGFAPKSAMKAAIAVAGLSLKIPETSKLIAAAIA